MPEILRGLKLAYESILPRAFSFLDDDDDLRFALVFLREFMRRHGVDPDPSGLVAAVMMHLAEKKQKESQQNAPSTAG